MTGIPALFALTLCLLIPPAEEDEKPDLICAKDFSAEVGEDVTLGCRLTGRNVTHESVYWKFNKKIYVLVFKERKVSSAAQDQKFKGRASEDSSWNPAEGKLSMKISSVKSNESGTYTCSIRQRNVWKEMSCSTTLSIRPKSDGRSGAPDGDPEKPGGPLRNKGNTANNTGDTGSFIQVLCLIGFAIIGLIIIHSIRPFRNMIPHRD